MQTIHNSANTYDITALQRKLKESDLHQNIDKDETMVNIEKSMFRTRIPRPLNPMLHLIVAGMMLFISLAIAIFYAEAPP